MRSKLSLLIVHLPVWIALALGGCVRRFEEARPDEPHAIVKVHVVHHEASGPELALDARMNDFAVAIPWHAVGPGESIRALRVRPEPAQWSIDTRYFHTVRRREVLASYRTERYPCGTQSSGIGSRSYSTTRYCTRQVREEHVVWVTDRVTDGECRQRLTHTPRAGAVYVLQYDYYGNGHCSAQCLRQLHQPDGSFRFVPCGAGEPPPESAIPTAGGSTDLTVPPVLR